MIKYGYLIFLVCFSSPSAFGADSAVTTAVRNIDQMSPIFNQVWRELGDIQQYLIDTPDVRRACVYIGELDPEIGDYNTGLLFNPRLLSNYLYQSKDPLAKKLLPISYAAEDAADSLANDVSRLENICWDGTPVEKQNISAIIADVRTAYFKYEKVQLEVEELQK